MYTWGCSWLFLVGVNIQSPLLQPLKRTMVKCIYTYHWTPSTCQLQENLKAAPVANLAVANKAQDGESLPKLQLPEILADAAPTAACKHSVRVVSSHLLTPFLTYIYMYIYIYYSMYICFVMVFQRQVFQRLELDKTKSWHVFSQDPSNYLDLLYRLLRLHRLIGPMPILKISGPFCAMKWQWGDLFPPAACPFENSRGRFLGCSSLMVNKIGF